MSPNLDIAAAPLYFRKVHAVIRTHGSTSCRTVSVGFPISPPINGIIWSGRLFLGRKISAESRNGYATRARPRNRISAIREGHVDNRAVASRFHQSRQRDANGSANLIPDLCPLRRQQLYARFHNAMRIFSATRNAFIEY